MSESYRALVAIMGLSIAFLWSVRAPVTWFLIEPRDFRVRAGLWLAFTLLLFVAHSFWIFAAGVAVLLWTAGRRDTAPLGLYCFLILLAPPFQALIQGFAAIRQFIDMDHLRLMTLVVLLPYSLRLMATGATPWLKMPSDKYLLGYVIVQLAVIAPSTSTTHLLRSMVSLFIDIVLPYYAFSRGITNQRQLRDVFAAFTCAAGLMACVGLFEAMKGWLLYSTVPNALGIVWGYGHYQMRDGALRALASAGHSIVFGYILMVALGLHLSLRSAYPSNRSWCAMLLLLVAGIAASASRGPWVGTAVLLTVVVLAGVGAGSRIGKAVGVMLIVVPVLALTPWGGKFLALLPFVGDYDEGSVDYRRQLFTVSWQVFLLNPWLGTPDFLANSTMQDMRQGEGIIDLVNSYVNIGLSTGLVGLVMFAGVFVPNAGRLWLSLRRPETLDEHSGQLARSLLAVLAGVGVTIATVAGTLSVALIYWCLAGMLAAFVHVVRSTPAWEQEPQASAPTRPQSRAARRDLSASR